MLYWLRNITGCDSSKSHIKYCFILIAKRKLINSTDYINTYITITANLWNR